MTTRFKKRPESIWVLYGGNSSERDVSLRSGKGIAAALKSKSFKVEGFDIKPGKSMLALDWSHPPDLVFLGLHGSFGEDGTIQGFLDTLEIPYVGCDVFSSALCFHKGLTKQKLSTQSLPVPFSFDIEGLEGFLKLEEKKTFPKDFYSHNWFLKPAREGSTVGIERYSGEQSQEGRVAFLERLNRCLKYDHYVLIEEWIEGREVTVPLLFGKALPIVEIKPLSHFYDYESKYTKGKTEYLCPAPFSESETRALQDLAEKAFRTLECKDYGRVDMMISKDGPKILEMNTLPGMTETSLVPKSALAAGLDYASFLEKLVCGSP